MDVDIGALFKLIQHHPTLLNAAFLYECLVAIIL